MSATSSPYWDCSLTTSALSTTTRCHPNEFKYVSILKLAASFESAQVVMFMKPTFDPEEPSESEIISARTSHIVSIAAIRVNPCKSVAKEVKACSLSVYSDPSNHKTPAPTSARTTPPSPSASA